MRALVLRHSSDSNRSRMMTLVFTSVRHFDADGAFAGNRRENVDALGFERGGDVVVERGDLFQLHAGRRMQFVARDGRALGDVAERDFDVELRERLLHQPRIGHQFFFGLRRLDRHVRMLEEIQRRQLVIADHRRGGDGDGLWFLWRGTAWRCGRNAGYFDLRLRFRLGWFAGFAGFVRLAVGFCREGFFLRRLVFIGVLFLRKFCVFAKDVGSRSGLILVLRPK